MTSEPLDGDTTYETKVDRPAVSRPILPRSPIRIAAESVLIVVSVLLAFGLNEWRMQRADRELARNVVDGLYKEIDANRELLETMQAQHVQLAEAIASLAPESLDGRPAFVVVAQNRVDGGSLINPPAEAAWQTALSTGALRLLDYETVSILSRIYLGQRDAVGRTSERIADLAFDTRMFDAETGVEAIQVFLALLRELASQEAHLMNEYENGLRRLNEIRR